jgi:hypothetical protein
LDHRFQIDEVGEEWWRGSQESLPNLDFPSQLTMNEIRTGRILADHLLALPLVYHIFILFFEIAFSVLEYSQRTVAADFLRPLQLSK